MWCPLRTETSPPPSVQRHRRIWAERALLWAAPWPEAPLPQPEKHGLFHGNPKPSFLGVITHILGVLNLHFSWFWGPRVWWFCAWMISSWWLNQPIWKILVKMGSSSPNRGENTKYLKPPPRLFFAFWFTPVFFGGGQQNTWRIIPHSKWLGSPKSRSHGMAIWTGKKQTSYPGHANWDDLPGG